MSYGIYRATALQPNITGQIAHLLKYGVSEESIFHIDSSLSDVRLLMQLPDLAEGDVLVMDSLDCIGDTCEQIRDNWKSLSDRKINLVVLSNPKMDTRNPEKAELNELFGQLMNVFLELQKKNRKKRQAEGIRDAQERGVHFGRRMQELPVHYYEVKRRWENGQISARDAAKELGISKTTFFRWASEMNR